MHKAVLISLLFFSACRYIKNGDEYKTIRQDLDATRGGLEERITQGTLAAEKEMGEESPFLKNIRKANDAKAQLADFMSQLIEAGDKSGTTQMDFDWKMLAEEIMTYKSKLAGLLPDSSALNTKTLRFNADSVGKTHFEKKSGEEIALYLSKMMIDVLLLNEQTVEQLRLSAAADFYPVDSLELRILARSSTVKAGQEFRAELLFAAHNTGEDRMFRVSQEYDSLKNDLAGEVDTVYADEDNDYRFHYSFKPKKAGDCVLYFMGTQRTQQGGEQKYPVRVKFKVSK